MRRESISFRRESKTESYTELATRKPFWLTGDPKINLRFRSPPRAQTEKEKFIFYDL